MNISKVYKDATTPQSVKEGRAAVEEKKLDDKAFVDGEQRALYEQWLRDPMTFSLIDKLLVCHIERIALAIQSNQQHNQQDTSRNLTEADTLERIINYVRYKTPIY